MSGPSPDGPKRDDWYRLTLVLFVAFMVLTMIVPCLWDPKGTAQCISKVELGEIVRAVVGAMLTPL